METWSHLDDVLDLVWKEIEAGANDPQHFFRTPTFGTAGIDQPQLRTVILRAVQREARALSFHSDRRSSKVSEIRSNDRIAWHAWNPERSLQLRLRGSATVHTTDPVADGMWESEPPASLGHYLKPEAPATVVDEPDDGLPDGFHAGDLIREDVADGRPHFAVIRTVIDEIDALHLQRGNHQRATFRWNESGKTFEGDWVVP
ncbi:pyridoxamine 5'-phosphate oxidase family protein [Longibacter sp.]|uniref:pyridoxamine 5'-phosphate oxidase family protein n=1 Tax=Longibacter sp. TaxID=2045415 RepID=UPI003EBEF378